MVITLSGVTGVGKSYLKKRIQEKLNLENFVITTTREPRNGEIEGIDKYFVTEKKFKQLEESQKIISTFEMLGYKYGYSKEKLQNGKTYVMELHYSTIYEFKKQVNDVFAIYLIPYDIKRARQSIKERDLPPNIEDDRLREVDEHIKNYSQNEDLRKQFDYVIYNDYTEKTVNKIIDLLKVKIGENK